MFTNVSINTEVLKSQQKLRLQHAAIYPRKTSQVELSYNSPAAMFYSYDCESSTTQNPFHHEIFRLKTKHMTLIINHQAVWVCVPSFYEILLICVLLLKWGVVQNIWTDASKMTHCKENWHLSFGEKQHILVHLLMWVNSNNFFYSDLIFFNFFINKSVVKKKVKKTFRHSISIFN